MGGDGYDIAYITGHINPYSGYDDFEEVHATLENDVVNYSDGSKRVATWGGDDTINVLLQNLGDGSLAAYRVDGGAGQDTVILQKAQQAGNTTLTLKNIEMVKDSVTGKSIAWVTETGQEDVISPTYRSWTVEDGFAMDRLTAYKIGNTDSYRVYLHPLG